MRFFTSKLCNLLVFLSFLVFFVLGTGWFEKARLVVEGKTTSSDSVIDIGWDSGGGFNNYESRRFHFLPAKSDTKKNYNITIAGIGKKQPASKGAGVLLTELRIDDHGIHIPKTALNNVKKVFGRGWLLHLPSSEISVENTAKQHIYFSFATNNRSGFVKINIDGHEFEHDLYRSNWEALFAKIDYWLLDEKGQFKISFDLPRYAVDSLLVKSSRKTSYSATYVETKAGRIDLPGILKNSREILIKEPSRVLKRFFHPAQFAFQCVFSVLLTWLLLAFGRLITTHAGIKNFFLGENRWVFTSLFLVLVIVNGLWLCAFWPGVMSVDSLNIWRAALFPEVMINNHPLINEVWYMFLLHLWNNIAIVPIIHILLFSCLTSAAFYFCYRLGVKIPYLLFCFFPLLFSLPIWVYNATLWKDVPFALLVCFWALLMAYFYYRKQREGSLNLKRGHILGLFLLFLALPLFRYNGLIYLLVIPPFFVFLGLVRVPKSLILGGVVIGCGLLWIVFFPPSGFQGASYFHDLSRSYLKQLDEEKLTFRLIKTIKKYPRLLDINKNKKDSDFWHFYLGDRYAYSFLRDAEWSDAFKYRSKDIKPFPLLNRSALQVYKLSLQYPWVYFSWYPFWFLYLFPVAIILYRWFPMSAVFSSVILVQVFALLFFVGTTNWRYYYFVLVGGHFLLPLLLVDWHLLRSTNDPGTSNRELSA